MNQLSYPPTFCADYAPNEMMLYQAEIEALSVLMKKFDSEYFNRVDNEFCSTNLLRIAQNTYKERRLRDHFFQSELFSEPAWDMILEAYCSKKMGRELTVSGICYASHSAPSTGLRWVNRLTRAGILQRQPSKSDGRKTLLQITSSAYERVELYFSRINKSLA